jgi:hypothetical protein
MRSSLPFLFTILALIVMSICSACVSPSQPPLNETYQHNGGPVQITSPADSTRISFEEAKAKLTGYRFYELNELGNAPPVYYVRSRDVDGTGNATGWIFGIHNGNRAEYLVYERSGWTTIANATLPSEKIALDSVLSPDLLFKKNRDLITGDQLPAIPERRDIELQRGMYTLTINAGSTTRILTFNATTGALIS